MCLNVPNSEWEPGILERYCNEKSNQPAALITSHTLPHPQHGTAYQEQKIIRLFLL